MSQELWTDVERYVDGLLIPSDPVLEAAINACEAAELPPIAVTPGQGKLLYLLARVQRAKRILEIGTLGGYSTIWLARALPADGSVVTLELEKKHADVAMANIAQADLSPLVDLRVGRALETLPELAAEGLEPFDMVFIDADKENTEAYFRWAMRLSREGAIIVVDNVIREGEVADPDTGDERVQGIRRFNEMLAAETRVEATTIQTVGSKGYDGFTLAVVTGQEQ
ncbi:MAG TPA: O-methyltransferase [Acidobacteriaceae bacterium]|nr:O-methyltransferase [Acidobacteriaceae bacterium]